MNERAAEDAAAAAAATDANDDASAFEAARSAVARVSEERGNVESDAVLDESALEVPWSFGGILAFSCAESPMALSFVCSGFFSEGGATFC